MKNIHFYLSENSATAQPLQFDFEDKTYNIFPYDTFGIARILERWVVQYVMHNVEMLRPEDTDLDPISWRIYNDSRAEVQASVESGQYGAGTQKWTFIINSKGPGYSEGVHQSIAWKNPTWTREMTKRLLASKKEEIETLWMTLNWPELEKKVEEKSAQEQE